MSWKQNLQCTVFVGPLLALAILGISPLSAHAGEPSTNCDCSCCGLYEWGGWQVHETKNFRLHYYGREPQLAELATVCEQSRLSVRRMWLGVADEECWSPKCDVFLYTSPQHYARCTGCNPENAGYSSLKIGFGKVWKRRLDLRIDKPGYLEKVLPHELAHVVLADRFRTQQIPRWADEGIAILAEPPQRRRELQQLLTAAWRSGAVFSMADLMSAKAYPADRARADLFYAQSISLVEFLVGLRSQADLVRLLETAQQCGYEPALRTVFGIDGSVALGAQWNSWMQTIDGTNTDPAVLLAQSAPDDPKIHMSGKQSLTGPQARLHP